MVAAPTSFEAPPSSPGSRAHVKNVLKKHEGVKVGAATYEPISREAKLDQISQAPWVLCEQRAASPRRVIASSLTGLRTEMLLPQVDFSTGDDPLVPSRAGDHRNAPPLLTALLLTDAVNPTRAIA